LEVLKKLIDAVRQKRRELLRDRLLIPYHNSVPACSSLQVLKFLTQKSLPWIIHCSLDFAPADFWPAQKLKSVLKGKQFSDLEDIKSSVNKF
jgi:hypothetical protein